MSRNWLPHHVGGYLKIAPEHTEDGPLGHMMKPGIGTYDRFKAMFDKYTKEAGKKQYLIPYFIAAHPGTTDEDMLNLALWLKRYKFKADQVQTFYPSPMATATAMYHTQRNPLKRVSPRADKLPVVRKLQQRKLHKAFLRYHDPENWALLRDTLKKMGRRDLIGNGKMHLVPPRDPPKRHRVVKWKAPIFCHTAQWPTQTTEETPSMSEPTKRSRLSPRWRYLPNKADLTAMVIWLGVLVLSALQSDIAIATGSVIQTGKALPSLTISAGGKVVLEGDDYRTAPWNGPVSLPMVQVFQYVPGTRKGGSLYDALTELNAERTRSPSSFALLPL